MALPRPDGEIVGDENAQTPFELLSHKNMHGQLDGLLTVLDARELHGGDCMSAINVPVVEGLTRNESVDEIAVESVGYLLK